jgi:transposase
MARSFREYTIDQMYLLPPDVRDWLPEKHRAWFVSETIDSLDISKIESKYKTETGTGPKAYAPRMLLKVLVYGYCVGVRSSRKLERATYEQVAFRVLSAGQHPDHDTVAAFRRENLEEVEGLFLQVLGLCKKAGLLKMGHVVLDGTKIKASANKSKSRSYQQLEETEADLRRQVREMLKDAEAIDQEEDERCGKGKQEEDLPEELWSREKRLEMIAELKKKIEAEAEVEREKVREEVKKRRAEDGEWEQRTGQKIEGRYPQEPGVGKKPLIAESRRNPTDFDSRVMKEGLTGGFIQAYNCQAVVDLNQIILVAEVTNQNNDKALAPLMMAKLEENTGEKPEVLSADSGYFGERDLVRLEGIDCYIPPLERDEGKRIDAGGLTLTQRMKEKLKSVAGKAIYAKRKCTIEPVFGQIKETQSFRQFLLRGREKVAGEWRLIALCHNLKKLHMAQLA